MASLKKIELLEQAMEEFIFDDNVLAVERGGVSEDEVCMWTIEKLNSGPSIMLHYFTWTGEGWADKAISEIEGPALLNCPIRFFEHSIAEEDQFPQWRYEVKKFHEEIGPEVQDDEVGERLIKSLEKKWKEHD